MKKFVLLLLLFVSTGILLAQAPPSVGATIEQNDALPGENICVSVRVNNFSDVQGMQWGIRWDPEVLEFTELANFNLPDLDLTDFNIGATAEGTLVMSWFTLRPPFSISLADQTVILDICFRVNEDAPNGFSSISFDNELITTEIVVDPNLYDQQVVDLPQMQAGGIQITQPGAFSITAAIGIDQNCSGNAGTIALTPVNGVPPYSYHWTGPENFTANQPTLSGLNPGIYSVTATDADGQTAIGYFPISIHGSPDPLPDFLLNTTITGSSCLGNTGRIVLAPNPAGQFTYDWNTGDTTPTIENLSAGIYRLQMTNAAGCVQSFSFTVTQEEAFNDIVVLEDSLSCITGRAQIGVMASEEASYRYRWSFGASSNMITINRSGDYQLTVSTNNGCTRTYSFFVGEPQLDLSFSRIDGSLGCADTAVNIGLNLNQPTTGLQFSWGNGNSTPQRVVQEPGEYQLQVSQGSCIRDFIFRVEQLDDGPFFYQRINQPFSCTQSTARVGVDASNDLNYSFQWENRPDTTSTIDVSESGTYTLTITNGRCSKQEIFTVAPFNQPDFTFTQRLDDQISCDPNDTARIGLPAAPNTSYAYQWSTGETNEVISVTDTGRYQVTVTEGICAETFLFQVSLHAEKEYDLLRDNITCSNPVAQIGITNAPNYFRIEGVTGESPRQTFMVDNPGDYTFTVLGGDQCVFTEEITVVATSDLSGFSRIEGTLDCTGNDSTKIGVQPTMDFGESLSYSWDTGQNDSVITVSNPGVYELSVSGNGNCFERYQFNVGTREDEISYERIDNQLNCRDNEATIGVRDAQPGNLLYAWSNSAATATTSIAVAGTYQLTITDPTTQCSRIESFTQEPRQIRNANLQGECLVSDLCGGQALYTASVLDGTAPFVYRWNTGQMDTLNGPASITLSQLTEVAVTVTDATGCQAELQTEAVLCTPLNEFKARMYFDCSDDPDAPNGILNTEVISGGLPPYEYNWNTGITDTSYFQSSVPFDADVDTYSVTVTDATGRQQTLTFQDTDRYSCGNQQSTTLTYLAPHVTVAPDGSFRYLIRATNYANVDRSIYTIDWDPCIVQADTIRLFLAQGNQEFTDLIPLEGTFEVSVGPYDPTQNPDTLTVAEIIFTPQNSGVSPFIFSINEPVTDAAGNDLPVRPLHGSITVAGADQLVQAGDMDNDGFIDEYDVLPIGLGFNEKGPDRRRELMSGTEFGYVWGQATPRLGTNFRYLDGDGDGRINAEDIETIDINWRPKVRNYSSTEGAPELTISNNVLSRNTVNTRSITLGDSQLPASGAYGLAFTIQYNAAEIDPQSIAVSFDTSWLVSAGDLTYVRHVMDRQSIHVALSGINSQPRTGSGPIAQLSFSVNPEAESSTTIEISDALLLGAEEERLPIAFAPVNLTIDEVNAQRNPMLDAQIRLFPNPAQDQVSIQAPQELALQHLQVRDINGRIVATKNNANTLSVAHLPEGIYLMYIKTNAGLAIQKFTVSGR